MKNQSHIEIKSFADDQLDIIFHKINRIAEEIKSIPLDSPERPQLYKDANLLEGKREALREISALCYNMSILNGDIEAPEND
jgi:uncharacterized protein (UPF0335 family)